MKAYHKLKDVIHFAGEHASNDRGWMQGALFSGLRASTEIKNTN